MGAKKGRGCEVLCADRLKRTGKAEFYALSRQFEYSEARPTTVTLVKAVVYLFVCAVTFVSFLYYYSEATELYIQGADYDPTCQPMGLVLVKDLGYSEAPLNSSLVSIERNTTEERVTLMSVDEEMATTSSWLPEVARPVWNKRFTVVSQARVELLVSYDFPTASQGKRWVVAIGSFARVAFSFKACFLSNGDVHSPSTVWGDCGSRLGFLYNETRTRLCLYGPRTPANGDDNFKWWELVEAFNTSGRKLLQCRSMDLEKEVPIAPVLRRFSEHLAQVITHNPAWFCRQRKTLWECISLAYGNVGSVAFLVALFYMAVDFVLPGRWLRGKDEQQEEGAWLVGGQSLADMPEEDQLPVPSIQLMSGDMDL